jgi:peptide/nickel transport system permease protein
VAAEPEPAEVEPKPRGRRPNPRIAQFKRTFYFLRRNTLAIVGLAIIILLVVLALAALFQPINWLQLTNYCAGDYGPGDGHPINGSNQTGYWYYNTAAKKWETGGNFNPAGLCSSYVCTYETILPPNAGQFCSGQWYKTPLGGTATTPISYASVIGPTITLSPLSAGPLPLGALTGSLSSSNFFSIYQGIVRGADWSLFFSVSIVGIGATLGLFVGAVAGLWGGVVDEALMRLVDIFLSVPILLFVIVVITVVTQTVNTIGPLNSTDTRILMVIVGFAAVWWPFYARIVRGQVLVVREQKYVEAARASGASQRRILVRHIIPNSLYPVLIQFSLDVGTIPLLIGTLEYLGINLFPVPAGYFPEWGTLAATSITDTTDIVFGCLKSSSSCIIPWWQLFFPGLAIFLFAISVNLFSDGLRDALDPRLRR